MIRAINHVFSLHQPGSSQGAIPLILDSPHSGTVYPMDTKIIAPATALRTTWDAYVDELWGHAPTVGAALLAARFPRAYIDLNRNSNDIDPEMMDGEWDGPLDPTERTRRGMGLLRRYALPGIPMYAEPLSAEEVRQRISRYYEPYHDVLSTLIQSTREKFGQVWHIDCHSMKSIGNAMNVDSGSARPDFVVSDREGMSCDPAFTQWTANKLADMGYEVSINSPYKGGYIVQKYGDPENGRHCLQIEINRSIYMNEAICEKTEGFEELQHDLHLFLDDLATYIRSKIEMANCANEGKF